MPLILFRSSYKCMWLLRVSFILLDFFFVFRLFTLAACKHLSDPLVNSSFVYCYATARRFLRTCGVFRLLYRVVTALYSDAWSCVLFYPSCFFSHFDCFRIYRLCAEYTQNPTSDRERNTPTTSQK